MKRVIVIGLDGLEPKIVEAMLAAGELPNLQRLQAQGGFARVATTSPAQTPVAWSTFATGTNPGRTRHLRLHPPRPRDVSARPGAEPLRAEERVPPAQGREPPPREGGLGIALRRGDRLDHRPLSRARIRPTRSAAGCSRAWASPTSGAGSGPRRSTPAPMHATRESENVVRVGADGARSRRT